jgi:hypothetical protein
VIGITSTAWDVYFLYTPDAQWTDQPSEPGFWMHQLGGIEELAPRLDPDKLEAATREMVSKSE